MNIHDSIVDIHNSVMDILNLIFIFLNYHVYPQNTDIFYAYGFINGFIRFYISMSVVASPICKFVI